MKKFISTGEARKQISTLIHNVHEHGDIYVIRRYNRSLAVLSRPEAHRKLAVYLAEKRIQKILAQVAELLKEFY
jgi:PHD/YefM family antitoxin component YafN of YafNO toxin-antitoxin module